MAWPLPQDYNEAIQSPAVCFADPDLRQGQAEANALGMPMPYSGNFADVYQVRCPDGSRWAVKCFTRQTPGLRERYEAISQHLRRTSLPFAVDFTYLERGILVAGQWYPVLKMTWVEGLTLNHFAGRAADKPGTLDALLRMWVRMGTYLRAADVAHADLQHGNVLLVPADDSRSLTMKLVDYDGMWVPALAGKKSGEVGHASYQHPRRAAEQAYGREVDRFPLLLVATALRALMSGGSALWAKYDNGDNLLFTEPDLQAPTKSRLFLDLLHSKDAQTVALTKLMIDALRGRLEATPLPDETLPDVQPAPAPAPPPRQTALPAGESAAVNAMSGPARTGPRPAEKPWYVGESVPPVTRPTDSPPERPKEKRTMPRAVWLTGIAGLAALTLAGVLCYAVRARRETPPAPAPAADDARRAEEERLAEQNRRLVEGHIETLTHSRDANQRLSAAMQLGKMGRQAHKAYPALVGALGDPEVAGAAREALEKIGEPGKEVATELRDLLRRPEPKPVVKQFAIKKLVAMRLDPKEATTIYAGVVDANKSDSDICITAVREIGRAAQAGYIPALTNLLVEIPRDKDLDPKVRDAAGGQLPQEVRILRAALGDNDVPVSVRVWAAGELEKKGPAAKDAVRDLADALPGQPPELKHAAVAALAKIGPGAGGALKRLTDTLREDKDPALRCSILNTISTLAAEGKPASREVQSFFSDPDPELRKAALAALDAIDPEAKPAAHADALLADGAVLPVRREAAQFFARLGKRAPPSLEPRLIEALDKEAKREDKSEVVLLEVAKVVALSAPRAPVPTLVALLRSGDDGVSGQAYKTLESVAPSAPATLTAVLKDEKNMAVRVKVAVLVLRADPRSEAAVGALAEGLKADRKELRIQAGEALAGLGAFANGAEQDLVAALDDGEPVVCLNAAKALAKINPRSPAPVPALAKLLSRDTPPEIRLQASEVLVTLAPAAKDAVPALSDALKAKDDTLRRNAATALAKIGAGAYPELKIDNLIAALDDAKLHQPLIELLVLAGPGAQEQLVGGLKEKNPPAVRLGAALAIGKLAASGQLGDWDAYTRTDLAVGNALRTKTDARLNEALNDAGQKIKAWLKDNPRPKKDR